MFYSILFLTNNSRHHTWTCQHKTCVLFVEFLQNNMMQYLLLQHLNYFYIKVQGITNKAMQPGQLICTCSFYNFMFQSKKKLFDFEVTTTLKSAIKFYSLSSLQNKHCSGQITRDYNYQYKYSRWHYLSSFLFLKYNMHINITYHV